MKIRTAGLFLAVVACGIVTSTTPALAKHRPPPPPPPPILSNSCASGYVTFTFDDGPGPAPGYPGNTQNMINRLLAEHIPAVFFVIGANVAINPQLVREEATDGFVIGNHTWDHQSFTGYSTGTPPLTNIQVISELSRDNSAVTAAGAPAPTLWRPPYGDVNDPDNYLASTLGLRIVMDYGTGITDSLDWEGISPAQIASNVTLGYTENGIVVPGIQAEEILAFHDGSADSVNTIAALPAIVTWMNAHQFCATSAVRPDATGGQVTNYTSGAAALNVPTHNTTRPSGHTGA